MKTINIKTCLMACAALSFMASGCDNAEYKVIDNAIYWEEASEALATKVTVDPKKEVNTSLTARIASSVQTDIVGEIELDADFLTTYNKANGTSYEILPAEYSSYNNSFVIKAGQVAAENTMVTIKPYSSVNGELYALPLKIKVAQGDIATIGESSKFILLLNQPLVQSVPVLKSANMASTNPNIPWNVSTNAWTIEAWIKMDGFDKNNQAIFNSGGSDTEIYIRFGDASIPYSSLQIKTQGAQVNTVTQFEKNKWYHVAVTYDAVGLVTIYINGVKDVTLQTKGGLANIEQMQIVSSGSYFVNTCRMAQLRLWKVALSSTQIDANMYYNIKPDDSNLLGYWRMDEGTGVLFKDCTSNKRDMTSAAEFTWEKDIRFDK